MTGSSLTRSGLTCRSLMGLSLAPGFAVFALGPLVCRLCCPGNHTRSSPRPTRSPSLSRTLASASYLAWHPPYETRQHRGHAVITGLTRDFSFPPNCRFERRVTRARTASENELAGWHPICWCWLLTG